MAMSTSLMGLSNMKPTLLISALILCASSAFASQTGLESNIAIYSESIEVALKSYRAECSDWDNYPKACQKKELALWHDLIFLEGLLHAQLDRLDAPGYDGRRDEIRAHDEQALKRVRYQLDCGIGRAPNCAEQKEQLDQGDSHGQKAAPAN
jgi:hypothetical protein